MSPDRASWPDAGIPLKNLAICADDDWAFRASDGACPRCGTTDGWMLLPTKFHRMDDVRPTDVVIKKD